MQSATPVIDIDPQHLAEKRLQILPVVLRIIFTSAVAETDVEESVGTESDLSALVIAERLVHG